MTIDIPEGYEALGLALGQAVAQAACGKGSERHAESGEKFSDQLIMSIPKRLGEGGECFCLGQALKKICESRRLPPDRARAELLGAINYLAAAWCLLGGRESVFAPERLFGPGEDVEILDGGGWRPASYVRPEDGGLHTVLLGSSRLSLPASGIRKAPPCAEDAGALARRIREANPAVYPQEDCEAPLFAEGERVKYAVQGKWEDGAYVGVDPDGKHVVSTGSSYIHLDGSLVKKA